MKKREVRLAICFFCFCYPISVSDSQGTGLSANYSFALLPPLYVAMRASAKRVPPVVALSMVVFCLIFCCAVVLDPGVYPIRRLVSFLIFMTMFSFAFVEIDAQMVRAFKAAVIGIGVYFSSLAIYTFATLGAELQFGAKAFGSQRFGFMYLLGLWLAYFYRPETRARAIAKYAVAAVLSAGLLLTFSRASIVALIGSASLFGLAKSAAWARRPSRRAVKRAVVSLSAVAVLVFALSSVLPTAFEFFKVRLFEYGFNEEAVARGLADRTDSLGTRLAIASDVLGFVKRNPLTGSGYLGVWILPDLADIAGSAHNQYLDVLFRTGVAGFAAYLGLLFFVMRQLRQRDPPLFWGAIGVLMYGFFHETFKEAQGAFLLAFLLGIAVQSWRRSRLLRRRAWQPAVSAHARAVVRKNELVDV